MNDQIDADIERIEDLRNELSDSIEWDDYPIHVRRDAQLADEVLSNVIQGMKDAE